MGRLGRGPEKVAILAPKRHMGTLSMGPEDIACLALKETHRDTGKGTRSYGKSGIKRDTW